MEHGSAWSVHAELMPSANGTWGVYKGENMWKAYFTLVSAWRVHSECIGECMRTELMPRANGTWGVYKGENMRKAYFTLASAWRVHSECIGECVWTT